MNTIGVHSVEDEDFCKRYQNAHLIVLCYSLLRQMVDKLQNIYEDLNLIIFDDCIHLLNNEKLYPVN